MVNQYYCSGIFEKKKNYISHHGIKGQKWGIRRFQNEDGKRHITVNNKGNIVISTKKATKKGKRNFVIKSSLFAGALAVAYFLSKHPKNLTRRMNDVKNDADTINYGKVFSKSLDDI